MVRVLFLLAFVLAGCGAPRSTATGSKIHTVDVQSPGGLYTFEMASRPANSVGVNLPAQQVWAMLPEVYAELGLPVNALNAQTRVVETSNLTARRRLESTPLSRYLNCGSKAGMRNAETYTVLLSVRTQVEQEDEESSLLRTVISASARNSGNSDPAVPCTSTGVLEREIEKRAALRAVLGS